MTEAKVSNDPSLSTAPPAAIQAVVADVIALAGPGSPLPDGHTRTITAYVVLWCAHDVAIAKTVMTIIDDDTVDLVGGHRHRFICYPGDYFSDVIDVDPPIAHATLEEAMNMFCVELSAAGELGRLLIPVDPAIAYIYAVHDTLWEWFWQHGGDGGMTGHTDPKSSLVTGEIVHAMTPYITARCHHIFDIDRISAVTITV